MLTYLIETHIEVGECREFVELLTTALKRMDTCSLARLAVR